MGNEAANDGVDIRDYLRPLWKRLWLIVLIIVVVTGGTYLYYDSKEEVYEASTRLFVAPSSLDQLLFGTVGPQNSQTVENLAILLQTGPVAEQVAAKLDFEGEPRSLLDSVSAAAEGDSDFIEVVATANSGKRAAAVADAFARVFIGDRAQQIRGEATDALAATEQELNELPSVARDDPAYPQRANLEAQIQQLRLIQSLPAGAGGSGLRQVEPAVELAEPVEPDPARNAIFAFAVSFLLGVGAALGLDRLDRRVHRVEDVEDLFGQPVLAELPSVKTPAPMVGGAAVITEPFKEPFRRLHSNLQRVARERPLKTIVIVSATPGEGKSIVTRNLALTFEEAGKSVAVLDTDFRKPSLAGLFGAESGPGLAGVLSGSSDLNSALQEIPIVGKDGHDAGGESPAQSGYSPRSAKSAAGAGGLALVTTGPEPDNPTAALATGRMRETLESAASRFDVVLVDSPPLLAVSDALPLLSEADGVILVARVGSSTRDSSLRLLTELGRVPDVSVIGVVANAISSREHRARAYGYGAGYRYRRS